MEHNNPAKFKTVFGLPLLIIVRLCLALVLNILGRILESYEMLSLLLFSAGAVIAGYDLVADAFLELIHKNIFNEDLLILIVAVAAAIVDEMEEAATIILLFQMGECVQDASLAYCVKKINRVAADHFNREDLGNDRKLMKQFSAIYTPCMLGCALIFGLVYALSEQDIINAVYRGLVIIVAACPCAIVISVPLAYSAGIAAAAEKNIFFKGDLSVDLTASLSAPDDLAVDEAYDKCISVRTCGPGGKLVAVVRRSRGEELAQKVFSAAKRIHRTAMENLVIALALKAVVIVLGILGKCPVWLAVFADAGISIITIANALKLLSLPIRSKKIRLPH